eukprot:CAMPEP_0183734486 /NCGR_PEP_ID=MMETSP0737-20130205/43931_1 /TAXON_ID=385413 /ORGANISM="Thalassiosira miniscula, Strain CCMP1093" /LENGTH=951 /DNA_ID=CAMNT_0025967981 /DNA_START=23 /DNA_END=2878 /DNA_ORIENTATION=-
MEYHATSIITTTTVQSNAIYNMDHASMKPFTHKKETPRTEITELADLPPEVICRILLYLSLSSRSKLGRCGSVALRQFVNSFDQNLMIQPLGRDKCVPLDDYEGYDALRRELIHKVANERWLPRPHDRQEIDLNSPLRHGPCHLRRLTKGDFLFENNTPSESYSREIQFYSHAQLIDNHIWVLYSFILYSFEMFDLDTGKAIDFSGCGIGPKKYYVSDSISDIALIMSAYGGRYGMLAVGMYANDDPHGAWSGPYLIVCDISTNEVIMSIDLYRPLSKIAEVNVVSRDRVAILLVSADEVELQWHRIPDSPAEMKGDPPPPTPDKPGHEPPPHECTNRCTYGCEYIHRRRVEVWSAKKEFWEEYRRRECREKCSSTHQSHNDQDNEDNNKVKPSYNSRCEYLWWPGGMTLIQSNIRHTGGYPYRESQIATMSSDSGMLVVVLTVTKKLLLWHVGTMSLIRECDPFDEESSIDFDEEIGVDEVSVSTYIYPIEDVLGPGEGGYYSSNQKRKVPKLKQSRLAQGSLNPVDLTQCDELTILSRFAHLTHDEQRDFENGLCGQGVNGRIIKRDRKMKEGSCSPQLDCIVRVAFAVQSIHSSNCGNYIIQVDVNPFHHIRHRESLKFAWDDKEEILENLRSYERACLGVDTLWNHQQTFFVPDAGSGGQTMCVLSWERGGMFDFYEAGPCDKERKDNMNKLLADNLDIGDNIENHPQLLKLCKIFCDVEEKIMHQRSITSIHIDTSKLIISTRYEVVILPFCLNIPEPASLKEEDWRESWCDERELYRCDKNTGSWHCFRPVDDTLISWWNNIRSHGNYTLNREIVAPELGENDVFTITADLNKSLEHEKAFMDAAFIAPCIRCFISWRYLAVISSSLSNPHHPELLHVFDILSDWNRNMCSVSEAGVEDEVEYSVESGLHFYGYYLSEEESSHEESSHEESSSAEPSEEENPLDD